MKIFNKYLRQSSIKSIKKWLKSVVEIKKPKDDKPFFIGVYKEKKVSYESIYGKMREKQRLVDMFKTQICDLKKEFGEECENAKLLDVHINELKIELSDLWDQFRGKVKEKVKKTIYIPMTVDQAVNYLAFLMNENAIKYDVDIRCVLDCIRNDPEITFETKDEVALTRLKTNLEYIKKKREENDNIGRTD